MSDTRLTFELLNNMTFILSLLQYLLNNFLYIRFCIGNKSCITKATYDGRVGLDFLLIFSEKNNKNSDHMVVFVCK